MDKIVKLLHTPKDPATEEAKEQTVYHFKIDRDIYDQLDMERVTNPKGMHLNFLLSSFVGKVSRKDENGRWVEQEMSKEDFHALMKKPEMGVIVSAFAYRLTSYYGGADEVEVFLG